MIAEASAQAVPGAALAAPQALAAADAPPGLLDDPRLELAQALAAGGQTSQALETYRQIGAAQSERHLQDALVLEQRSSAAQAAQALKKSLAADPSNFRARLKQARMSAGAQAEQACREALALQPGNPEASLRLAQLLLAAGRAVESAACLDEALPGQERNFELRLALARIHMQLGDFSAAEIHFQHCIALDTSDLRAYLGLLEMMDRLDRVSRAEDICRFYLSRNPPELQILLALAHALVRQEFWSEAEKLYGQLLVAMPASLPLRQLYADMLRKSGRVEAAVDVHRTSIQIEPGNPESYQQLADLQRRLGDRAGATRSLAQAARLYTGSSAWGLNGLPETLGKRLIFDRLDTIADRYCTGRRALVDCTGIDLDSRYAPGQIVELFCMVAGMEHIRFLEQVAYPALAATPGFEDMLRERTVVYNLYTTPAHVADLREFLDLLESRGIRYRINVELFCLSQDLYSILCLPIIDQVRRALATNSVVVMALPDAIISGSIAQVIRDMKPGETVACAMPRIDSCAAYPVLRERLKAGGLPSREFVRLCLRDFLHPQTYSALRTDSNCLRYRDMDGYVSAHNWVPPPVCFYARPEMIESMLQRPLVGPDSMASFFAIDHDFIESAFRGGCLRLIDDSDYFFWAEFTHPERHTDFLAGRKAEDYYYPEASRAIYRHEFKWIYSDARAQAPGARSDA